MKLLVAPGYFRDTPFNFTLLPELEASEQPEARDEVRLMVSYCAENHVIHTQFRELVQLII